MKKTFWMLGALALAVTASAADPGHKLTKLWESEAALKTPESVRFDAARKVLYVSNIDGEPWTNDGKGSIAKLGAELDRRSFDRFARGLDKAAPNLRTEGVWRG